jgi:Family of unknown function (DUF6452)
MKKIILILLFAFSFSACEKDDICDAKTTETTPKLVVEFYDIISPTTPKSISNLVLTTDGVATGISYTANSKILVPLKINADTVTYKFIQNGASNPLTNVNVDIITINYKRINTYVSRACGYKTTFELNATNGVMLTDGTPNDALWMREVAIQNVKIENENEVHVKILY